MKSELAVLAIFSMSMMACSSEHDSGITLMSVDSQQQPLPDAQLWIHTESSTIKHRHLDTTLTTNESGSVDFDYPYECFLNVRATCMLGNTMLVGDKEIHIEADKHKNDTIILW